ncbi:MAG: undecaprenyl-diphosphate phosphatase [Alphaproteobacteria bacterium]|jgi:undecaprenyl-diphosphatase|nr:undecaprenyl-diphosphate phosphatase [Alphaproteobacteria bacterium]
MTLFQGLVLALLQGLTELFPVSSLGHAVLAPALLRWPFNEADPAFLPFLVALHLGTAVALLLYFRRDWAAFISALAQRGEQARATRHVLWLLVVGTVPAGLIGAAFEHTLRSGFASPFLAAVFLAVNGIILFAAERLRRRGNQTKPLSAAGWVDALLIGISQAAALIPGISRSGATMVGGLLRGLDHEEAARFSFLLGTPVIGGAALLEIPKLFTHSTRVIPFSTVAIASVVAGVTAYLSAAFLMRYFRKREVDALNPFAAYCTIAGLIALALLR